METAMIVRSATPADVHHVLSHLREHNRREMAACRWEVSTRALAREIKQLEEVCIQHFSLAGADGTPVALTGAWLVAPGVALVRLCATDQWLTIARPAYRWLKRVFIPCVLVPNVRRAETRVLDTGDASRAWLRKLGFRDEGIARALGKNGEDFVHVAWINPNLNRGDHV
jgi:hypothetical protein